MSKRFQGVMRDLHEKLTGIYSAETAVLVPGGGSYAMESVARQFASDKDRVLILRNGFFSFRWSQIFDRQSLAEAAVMKAKPVSGEGLMAFAPAAIEDLEAAIKKERPAVIFAPHVETSAGVLLPEDYIKRLGAAAREVDALFVLDGIAGGLLSMNMAELNVDVYLTSTQKGWSSPASTGVVLLGSRAVARMDTTTSTSFSMDLKAWHKIMRAYLDGGHAYHATMATDAIASFHSALLETLDKGLESVRAQQWALGTKVRSILAECGLKSVAAPGFEAPTVVVVHTSDATLPQKFAAAGVQTAAGVPLMLDHDTNAISEKFRTIRFGLFGLDKLVNVDACAARLEAALTEVLS
jgi:aspartate aminotransferase-like enzyme